MNKLSNVSLVVTWSLTIKILLSWFYNLEKSNDLPNWFVVSKVSINDGLNCILLRHCDCSSIFLILLYSNSNDFGSNEIQSMVSMLVTCYQSQSSITSFDAFMLWTNYSLKISFTCLLVISDFIYFFVHGPSRLSFGLSHFRFYYILGLWHSIPSSVRTIIIDLFWIWETFG